MGGPVSASTGRPCIAALDVGTSSVKACLFTPELNLLACSVREYRLRTENGRVEARAEDYLEAAAAGMREALDMAPGWRPAALGLTTQGETLVPVGRAGEPLGPFLVWLDSRAGAEAELLSGAFDRETVYRATGLPELSGALPLAKALWLRREEPEVFARTEKLLLLEDYLLHWLTGRLAGEKSLHTSTGWFHLGRDDLWEEALAAAGIPVGMLPELLDCGEPVGPLLPGPAEALGLPPGIPVATGAMDQTAAALAAGCVAPGAVTETTGTALVAAACTEAPVFAEGHHVTIYRHALAGKYLYLPIGNTAGMALRWFRDEFCRDLPADGGYAALDAQAAKVPCGSDGLVFLPFLAGSVDPDACPEARAVFFGATLSTTRAHFARSVMESVAFLLRDFFALLEGLGCPVRTVASLGGGARSGLWQQIKADVCGRTFTVPACTEAAAMGAALLAGWAGGLIEPGRLPETAPAGRYVPCEDNGPAYQRAYELYRRLYGAVRPLYGSG